jgi:hypothetical protein
MLKTVLLEACLDHSREPVCPEKSAEISSEIGEFSVGGNTRKQPPSTQ